LRFHEVLVDIVTHTNEWCHTCGWVNVTRLNESCHTYDTVMSPVDVPWEVLVDIVTRTNESYHIYEWVMLHVWMSHVTWMNESCPPWMSLTKC